MAVYLEEGSKNKIDSHLLEQTAKLFASNAGPGKMPVPCGLASSCRTGHRSLDFDSTQKIMPTTTSKSSVKTAILSLLLVALAGLANGAMDTISFRYDRSLFVQYPHLRQWADPATSWKNKWKNGDPTQGEAFPLSSTALVGTTDAWHLFKGLMLLCLITAIVLPFTHLFSLPWTAWIGIVLGVKFIFSCAFEIQFAWLLLR